MIIIGGDMMGEKLSNKQITAIQCLITAPTKEEAAKMANCSTTTLRKWLNEPEFVKAYQEAQTRLIDGAVIKARRAIAPALELLTEIMNDKTVNPQTRVYAARSLTDFSIRLVELTDVLRKLEALEAWKEERENEYLD